MTRGCASQQRLLALTMAMAVPAATTTGCAVTEHRIVDPEADWAAAEVEARIEVRKGKRKATWKPIVAGVIAAATAGAVSMMWVGFLRPNRPLAVAGIVGSVTLPTLGTIPFLLRQDVPWTTTEWKDWAPAGRRRAQVDVIGRQPRPLATHVAVTDDDGALHVPFSTTLCAHTEVRELQLVDLVVRVPGTEEASLSVPVDRLPCGGGRLSLLEAKESHDHDAP